MTVISWVNLNLKSVKLFVFDQYILHVQVDLSGCVECVAHMQRDLSYT